MLATSSKRLIRKLKIPPAKSTAVSTADAKTKITPVIIHSGLRQSLRTAFTQGGRKSPSGCLIDSSPISILKIRTSLNVHCSVFIHYNADLRVSQSKSYFPLDKSLCTMYYTRYKALMGTVTSVKSFKESADIG